MTYEPDGGGFGCAMFVSYCYNQALFNGARGDDWDKPGFYGSTYEYWGNVTNDDYNAHNKGFKEVSAEEAQQSDAVSYEYEIESTNSFGEMLAERMTSELPTEEESNAGYNINGVTMTDNIATVEYQAVQDCTIVVALYDEDGYEMLATANTQVSKDENKATITFAASEVPEYYLVKAYVVDDNMRPKCKEYVTNESTDNIALHAKAVCSLGNFSENRCVKQFAEFFSGRFVHCRFSLLDILCKDTHFRIVDSMSSC